MPLREHQGFLRGDPPVGGSLGPLVIEPTALNAGDNPFARLVKFQPAVGYELRVADTDASRFHGTAPDGTAETSPSWDVVRFYREDSRIVRVRFRQNVRWDQRELGW